ncbi:hypothetical protein GCM10009113_07520 [Marinobacter szutsaonensis]
MAATTESDLKTGSDEGFHQTPEDDPCFAGIPANAWGGVEPDFPEMSKARDGLRQAHMDVLVAVSGKSGSTTPFTGLAKLHAK